MYKTTPETAGIAIVDGIERRRSRVMIGNDVRLLDAIARITPTHYWSVLRGSLKAATDTRAARPSAGSDARRCGERADEPQARSRPRPGRR